MSVLFCPTICVCLSASYTIFVHMPLNDWLYVVVFISLLKEVSLTQKRRRLGPFGVYAYNIDGVLASVEHFR